MFRWPFLSESTLLVQGWGFWLGIVGLVIGVVGFAITIGQLRATKKVAEQVRDEIDRVRASVRAYDAYQETAKAQLALQSARKSLMRAEWDDLAVEYGAYLRAIHVIQELDISELAGFKEDIKKSIEYGKRLCERIEGSSNKSLINIHTGKTSSAIRDHEELLSSINVSLQGKALQ